MLKALASANLDSHHDLYSHKPMLNQVRIVWLEIFRSISKYYFPSLKT